MTDPTNPKQDPDTKPAADPEPEVEVEMVKDLDVPDDDQVRGGLQCGVCTAHTAQR
jgi:heterodisulfide reductase subunit C